MNNRILWTSALLISGFGTLLTGCKNNQVGQQAPIVDGNAMSSDPSAANLATQVAGVSYQGTPQGSATSYAPQPAQPSSSAPQAAQPSGYYAGNSAQNEAYQYNTQQPASSNGAANAAEYDEYADLLDPNTPEATQAPPPLPADYEQPEAPGADYLWTPGYWDYANTGYYYVPGTWVAAPYQGALWTPGWWGYADGHYRWHHGYWGRHVGFYGGINYGFGYVGFGYQGGYWNGDHFFYNRAVNRVTPRTVNNYVYDRRVSVVNNTFVNNTRLAYFGGPQGLHRAPTPAEIAAVREQHFGPMQAQIANRREAAGNRQQFFTANNGRPAMVVASRPLPADRNIPAPPRSFAPAANMPAQNMAGRAGEPMNHTALPPNANPQQRQQFEQQQHMQAEQQHNQQMQQANVQREQQMQQHNQQQMQHVQLEQQEQQHNQQTQQANVQRQQQMQEQQRAQQEQQHNQQMQQANVQRQQQVQEQQRAQQEQQHNQQSQQANVQRQQQMEQHNQQQHMQQEQQANAQRQQMQQNMQRQQQAQQQRQAQQRSQMEQQQRAAQQQHAIPAPHVEPPHAAAPRPMAEPPHPAPPQHPAEHH